MICVHTYITLRCERCGTTFGDEYAYGDTRNERTRIVGDARAAGWTGTADTARCGQCTHAEAGGATVVIE